MASWPLHILSRAARKIKPAFDFKSPRGSTWSVDWDWTAQTSLFFLKHDRWRRQPISLHYYTLSQYFIPSRCWLIHTSNYWSDVCSKGVLLRRLVWVKYQRWEISTDHPSEGLRLRGLCMVHVDNIAATHDSRVHGFITANRARQTPKVIAVKYSRTLGWRQQCDCFPLKRREKRLVSIRGRMIWLRQR